MSKNKISKKWIKRQNRDLFVKKSRIQGYRSRSAFKLIEIDKKFNLLSKSKFFLDLGASPGGWSQIASNHIKDGKILSVDIKNMSPIKNIHFLKGDFTNLDMQNNILTFFNTKIDMVVSDMAPNTTGNKNADSWKTGELCLSALYFSTNILKKSGFFISKIFMGSIFKEIQNLAKKKFKEVFIFKPESSRKESKEIYIICKYLK